MTEHLNHTKWAAWGVVNVEALDRQQRRNYLKKVREELAAVGYALHPGGTTQQPWYRAENVSMAKKQVISGPDAFQKICACVLSDLGEKQEQGDGAGMESVSGEPQVLAHS